MVDELRAKVPAVRTRLVTDAGDSGGPWGDGGDDPIVVGRVNTPEWEEWLREWGAAVAACEAVVAEMQAEIDTAAAEIRAECKRTFARCYAGYFNPEDSMCDSRIASASARQWEAKMELHALRRLLEEIT